MRNVRVLREGDKGRRDRQGSEGSMWVTGYICERQKLHNVMWYGYLSSKVE